MYFSNLCHKFFKEIENSSSIWKTCFFRIIIYFQRQYIIFLNFPSKILKMIFIAIYVIRYVIPNTMVCNQIHVGIHWWGKLHAISNSKWRKLLPKEIFSENSLSFNFVVSHLFLFIFILFLKESQSKRDVLYRVLEFLVF